MSAGKGITIESGFEAGERGERREEGCKQNRRGRGKKGNENGFMSKANANTNASWYENESKSENSIYTSLGIIRLIAS